QNALAEVFHANVRPESVYLWALPMFHCNGWCFPWAVTAAGATHVCLRKVDAPSINHAIAHEGVTHFCAAPTVLIGLANHPGTVPFPRRVVVTTAGAPPSPTTIAQIEALGAELHHVYGLTETYGPITECAWRSPHWAAQPSRRADDHAGRRRRPRRRLGAERRPGRRAHARRDRHARQQRDERLLRRPGGDGARVRGRLVPLRRRRRAASRRPHRDRRPREGRHHQRRREHLDAASGEDAARARGGPGVRRRRRARRKVGRGAEGVRHAQARTQHRGRGAAAVHARPDRRVQGAEGVRVLRASEDVDREDPEVRAARARVEGPREARPLASAGDELLDALRALAERRALPALDAARRAREALRASGAPPERIGAAEWIAEAAALRDDRAADRAREL